MSSLAQNFSSAARARFPRTARAAVERARLSVVPVRRSRAPRMPFAVLVFLILGAGVVGLLMFNTHMQQQSFYATSLQTRSDDLVARQQALDMELDRLRDPQRLAREGRKLGMVAPSVPAFIRLGDGTILGVPTAASPDDFVAVKPPAPAKPAALEPEPLVIKVQPKPTPANPGNATNPTTSSTPGSGTAETGSATGTNGTAPSGAAQPVTR